jgi:predicted nucleotidyltransferase
MMRLDDKTCAIIKNEDTSQLRSETKVRLFGSRIDDSQEGSGIDLIIEPARTLVQRIETECQLAARLFIKLDGRKVDVLIKNPPWLSMSKLSKMELYYDNAAK